MRPIHGRPFHSVGGTLVGNTLVGAPSWGANAVMMHPAVQAAMQAVSQQGAAPLAASQGAPYLTDQGPTQGRVQTLGFPSTSVTTLATGTASSAPQVWFRPDRLFLPSGTAGFFTVSQIIIGNKNQLLNGNGLTGSMFSELAVDSAISYDTCAPAVTISISLTNTDTVTHAIVPSMLGRSAY